MENTFPFFYQYLISFVLWLGICKILSQRITNKIELILTTTVILLGIWAVGTLLPGNAWPAITVSAILLFAYTLLYPEGN